MKRMRLSQSKNGSRSLLLIPLAAVSLLAVMAIPSYAGHHPAGKSPLSAAKPVKPGAASQAAPDVPLPFTFTCPHCSMKITIKTAADWNKDCLTCACGVSNLGCYHEKKK